MNISITTKNFTLDQETSDLVDERIAVGLEHLLGDFDESIFNPTVKIEQLPGHGYHVQFHMSLPGKHQIFAKEENDTLSVALTNLREDAERQIENVIRKLKEH